MRSLMRLFEPSFSFSLHARTASELFGPQPFQAACSAQILVPAGRADWVPCSRARRDCRRSVRAAPDGALPVIAPCGIEHPACAPKSVDGPELDQVALNPTRFLELLTRRFVHGPATISKA